MSITNKTSAYYNVYQRTGETEAHIMKQPSNNNGFIILKWYLFKIINVKDLPKTRMSKGPFIHSANATASNATTNANATFKPFCHSKRERN